MKFKFKDEDLVSRDLKEVIHRLPIEFRLAGLKPEELVKAVKKEDLKKLIELSKNMDLN